MAKLKMVFKTLGTKIATLWKTTTWFKIASIGGAVVIATAAVLIPNAIISETGGIFHKCDFSVENVGAQYLYSEANCTERAKYYYSCACGKKGSELLFKYGDALGHDLTHHASKQATCTEIGYDEYDACARCNYSEYSEIPATGHTDGEWVIDTDVTCTESGSKHQVCSVCGDAIKTATILATGHIAGDWITDVDATCTKDGSKHQVCSVCNDTLKTVTIAKLGHTAGEWITDKESNCTEDGSKHQVCSVCNDTIKTAIIPATGHTDGDWIIDKEANCTEDGSKHQVCSVCNDTIREDTIIATGHTFGDWSITQVATCAADGKKERICFCNFKETISYSVQHNSEYIETSQYGNDFVATWYCYICDMQYQKSFEPVQADISIWSLTSGYQGWRFSWKVDSYGGIGSHSYTFLVTSLYSGQVLYMSNWQSSNVLTWQSNFNDSWELRTPIRVWVYISDSVGGSTAYTFDVYNLWSVSNQQFYYTYTP